MNDCRRGLNAPILIRLWYPTLRWFHPARVTQPDPQSKEDEHGHDQNAAGPVFQKHFPYARCLIQVDQFYSVWSLTELVN